MATHCSTLAWKIPWMEEPGRLQSMGSWSRTRLSDFTFTFHFHALEKEMATHSSVLAWRIPEAVEAGGLPPMGLHRVGHDWSDLAVAAAAVWSCIILDNHFLIFYLLFSFWYQSYTNEMFYPLSYLLNHFAISRNYFFLDFNITF